jgi:low-density lipoprotein receptor-related protein 4
MKKLILVFNLLVLLGIKISAQQKIYWSNNTVGIMSSNLDGSDIKTLIKNRILSLSSFDIDTVNNKVYWTDQIKKHIGRSNIDGTNFEILLELPLSAPSNVRVDNFSNKIYWLEYEQRKLMRANLDGTIRETVASNLPNGYLSFELDISNNRIFWMDGIVKTIVKTNPENTIKVDIATGQVNTFLSNMRLDHVNKRVYWAITEFTDSTKNIIKTKTFDGTDEKIIFTKSYSFFHIIDFDINPFKNTLYIKDSNESNSSGYLIGNLNGTNLNPLFGYGIFPLMQIAGSTFTTIHRMDKKNNRLFILSGGGRIYWQTFTNNQYLYQQVTKETMISPNGIAIDKSSNKLYWTDPTNGKIQRANLDGSNIEDLVNTGNFGTSGIALDLINKQMYWTERTASLVRRANLDGSNPQTIINTNNSGNIFPEGVALDVENKKIYYTVQGLTGVNRANFDGTNIQVVIRSKGFINQIALELENKKIYWSEAGQINSMIRANLDGTQQDTFFRKVHRIDGGISLDVTNKKVYWIVDSVLQSINYDGTNAVNLIQNLPIQVGSGGYMTWGATHGYVKGEIISKTDELVSKLNVQVFPTIFDKTINVILQETTLPTYYIIYDVNGKICKEGVLKDTKNIENLDNLHSGFYVLKLINQNKLASIKVLKL